MCRRRHVWLKTLEISQRNAPAPDSSDLSATRMTMKTINFIENEDKWSMLKLNMLRWSFTLRHKKSSKAFDPPETTARSQMLTKPRKDVSSHGVFKKKLKVRPVKHKNHTCFSSLWTPSPDFCKHVVLAGHDRHDQWFNITPRHKAIPQSTSLEFQVSEISRFTRLQGDFLSWKRVFLFLYLWLGKSFIPSILLDRSANGLKKVWDLSVQLPWYSFPNDATVQEPLPCFKEVSRETLKGWD